MFQTHRVQSNLKLILKYYQTSTMLYINKIPLKFPLRSFLCTFSFRKSHITLTTFASHQFLKGTLNACSSYNKIMHYHLPTKNKWHAKYSTLKCVIRRRSTILKWGVNFSNNVIEPINIWGIRKKKERGGRRKKGVKIHPFHLPWIRAWLLVAMKIVSAQRFRSKL